MDSGTAFCVYTPFTIAKPLFRYEKSDSVNQRYQIADIISGH